MIKHMLIAAEAAGKVALRYFQTPDVQTKLKKGHQDIVTIADVEAQGVIVDSLTQALTADGVPSGDIGFIGEEQLVQAGKHTFIIDPIDGTSNFATGLDYFCVSIGYAIDGKLHAGVIYHPVSDMFFYAEKGTGSFKRFKGKDLLLKVTDAPLTEKFIGTYLWDDEGLVQGVINLQTKARGLRSLGAGALDIAHVADNLFGAAIFAYMKLWDLAAAVVIVEEAGGEVYDWKGNPLEFALDDPSKNYHSIAAHPAYKEEIMQALNGIGGL